MEYYSIFSHGMVDNKKLKPVHRKLNNNFIPIIMFGTQTYSTAHGMTLFYYILFTKNLGIPFLDELTNAIMEYPVQYAKRYFISDEGDIYQKAVKFLFTINLIEREVFPQNRFELFIQEDIIRQPLDVSLFSNYEMVVGTTDIIPNFLDSVIDKNTKKLDKFFDYIPDNIVFSTKMNRELKKINFKYDKKEKKLGIIYPYGLYRTNNISNLKFQKPIENSLSKIMKDIIDFTKEQNQRKQIFKHPKFINIGAVFVFCCKNSIKKIQNLQFPQEVNNSQLILNPIKLFFNPETKKFQVKKFQDKKKEFNEFEKKTAKKLNQIELKRKQRKDKKININSEQYNLENLFG